MIITPENEIKVLTPGSEKRVKCQCDGCGKITETSYSNYFRAQKAQNLAGLTYCRACAARRNPKLKGRTPWNKNKKLTMYSRENSSTWKGGRYQDLDGYWMILTENGSYKREHRYLMEKHLNRLLAFNEIVHHIDRNKSNNQIENLVVMKEPEHKKAHGSLEDIGSELLKRGYIYFDIESKMYVAHDKLRELLEHPEEDNQQPSLSGNTRKGSETSSES